MALSNIRNEPRREIIEQTLGIGVAAAVVVGGCYFGQWLFSSVIQGTGDAVFSSIFGVLILILVPFMIFLLAHLIHAIGEGVCAVLAGFGFDPRPKQRY